MEINPTVASAAAGASDSAWATEWSTPTLGPIQTISNREWMPSATAITSSNQNHQKEDQD